MYVTHKQGFSKINSCIFKFILLKNINYFKEFKLSVGINELSKKWYEIHQIK